jgi:hypothetical protein
MLVCCSFLTMPLLLGYAAAALPTDTAPQAATRRPPPQSVAPASVSLPELLLVAHNAQRSAAGVPPLVWDVQLAAGAAQYAPSIAATGQLVHSPRASRPNIGENLWVGTAGAYRGDAGVAAWAAERSNYRDGVFPNVSRTGNWLDVSHYTQMIWRKTTHVGCALARSPRWDALVCRYSPKGNRDGQRPR